LNIHHHHPATTKIVHFNQNASIKHIVPFNLSRAHTATSFIADLSDNELILNPLLFVKGKVLQLPTTLCSTEIQSFYTRSQSFLLAMLKKCLSHQKESSFKILEKQNKTAFSYQFKINYFIIAIRI